MDTVYTVYFPNSVSGYNCYRIKTDYKFLFYNTSFMEVVLYLPIFVVIMSDTVDLNILINKINSDYMTA